MQVFSCRLAVSISTHSETKANTSSAEDIISPPQIDTHFGTEVTAMMLFSLAPS